MKTNSPKISPLLFLIVLSLALQGPVASAAILASDGFEADILGALSGQGGGTGWGGAWGAPVGTAIADVVDATANPLAFTPAGGLPVNGGTNALEVYSSPLTNALVTSRPLGSTLPDVVYVSYLVRLNAGAGWSGNNTFSLHLTDSAANTTSINFGIRGAVTNSQFMVRSGTGTPVAANLASGEVAVGTNYFLVARFSKLGSTGAPSTTYDRCEIWVNPAGNANQSVVNGNARLQLATGTGLATLSHVILRQAALDADDRVWFDQLTVGSNWSDVVPLPPDTNAPVVTITSPANNSLYAPGIPVNLSATVTDDRGLSSVQLFTNGTFAATDNDAPYSFTLINLPAGPHTLTVVATDTSSNLGSNSISLLVTNVTGDVTPPVVTISSPTNGQNFLLGVSIPVSATVTDNVAVAYAELYADAALVGSDASSPYQFTVSNLLVGTHSLAVRGVDTSGNSHTNSISITVYTNPPTTSASILASDGFETDTLGALSGKAGGSGWSGNWGAPGATTTANVVDTTSAPLAYAIPGGASINGQTRALEAQSQNSANSQIVSARQLTNSIAQTFYAGYLVKYQAGAGMGGNNTFALHLSTNASSTATLNFGLRPGVAFVRYTTSTPVAGNTTNVTVGVGTNLYLVVKMNWNGSAFTSANLWVNPTANDNVVTPNGDASTNGFSCAAITHVFFRQALLDLDDVLRADEVKIGTQWSDVVPSTVTPPSTEFLGGTATLAFFDGMNLITTNPAATSLYVWSSATPFLSVTNWQLEGSMVETPLPLQPGFSRYALNVIPTVSPRYYVIGKTNTGPYVTNVPVHIITTADFVDYQYSQTNTTINAAGVLALGGPPLPPTITILTPTNGAQIVTGVGVVVSANAVAGTGAITNVSLYADNALLGSFAAPPYALTNSSLAIGAHTLTAIASDNLGLTATNGISITILPPLPPTITILTPTNGAQIVTGVGVVVSANAVAGTGAITNVSLYADNALLGSFAAPPYALTNSSLAIGAHALTAIASDNLGLTATNGISITILPLVSPAFTGIALNPDGAISLSFQVALGQSFQVQAATNLNPPVTWLSLVTNVSATTNVITFVDTNAPAYLKQFYRMVSP